MTTITLALGLALGQAAPAAEAPDPYRLKIGRSGEIAIRAGDMVDTATGRVVTPDDVAKAAAGHRWVYLGESHDNALHHQMQAAIIEALAKTGRPTVVGFEMFTRPVQDRLNAWTLGWQSEAEFIESSEWKTQWGFDFALYRPIFEATKKHRLPMVALNVPRDWVRQVGREGLGALTPEQRASLPEQFDLTNQAHRAVFGALMGGHPPTGTRGESIYSAQVLWDVGMADSAIKYMEALPRYNGVMAIVAGSGHVMYGQGINWRIAQRTGERGITVTMVAATDSITVSRGLGDYVYVAPGK